MCMSDETIIKFAGDVAAGSIAFAAVMSWLPAIASVLSITWFGIQIWESKTVQHAIKRWRERHVRKD